MQRFADQGESRVGHDAFATDEVRKKSGGIGLPEKDVAFPPFTPEPIGD